MRSIQVLPFPPGRCEVKSNSFPSGDQRGFVLSALGDVKRRGSPPSVGTTQIARWYLLSFSTAVCTWKAICDPSVDIAGALRTERRYQSASVNARLPCAWTRVAVEVSATRAMAVRRPERMLFLRVGE